MPEASRGSVGFGRASLWGSWKTDRKPADEIEVRALAATSGESAAIIAVADFMELWPASCRRIRRRLSGELGVAEDCIGIFATQNHGVDGDGPPGVDNEAIDRAFLAAARQALGAAEPAEVALIAVRPDPPLSVCRRIHFGPSTMLGAVSTSNREFGAFTFYFGYRLDERTPGRADVSHIIKAAISQMAEGKRLYPVRFWQVAGKGPEDYAVPDAPVPVPSPLYLPPPTDGLLQCLLFRQADGSTANSPPGGGRPIGSLLRFATHPNTANRGDVDWSSGDYPVYARRRMEDVFGGSSLFLTGPCGDSCPLIDRKGRELAEKVGTRIADAALSARGAAEWQPITTVKASSPVVELRVRPDYPASKEKAQAVCAEIESQIPGILAGGDEERIAKVKNLLEKWELNLYVWQGAITQWTGLDLTGRAGEIIKHPLYVARIGPATIAGLPGEPFGGISARLRKETLGDNLIVCEAGNGYLSYIPTAQEYPLGGYGPSAAILDASAEDRLVNAVKAAISL